jgi:hypothetical protein
MNASEQEKQIASAVVVQPESNRQPIWHVIVLHLFTMFGYSLVWFFKNCNQLSELARRVDSGEIAIEDKQARVALKTLTQINPALFALGLIVPGFQFVLTIMFFRTVVCLSPSVPAAVKRLSWVCGIAFTACMVGLLCLAKLPGAWYLTYLTASIPLAAAQHLLNSYWRSVEPEERMLRQAFSGSELAMLILGSVLLGLVVTGLVTQ